MPGSYKKAYNRLAFKVSKDEFTVIDSCNKLKEKIQYKEEPKYKG